MNIHFYNWILLTGIVISILIIIFILFPNYPYLNVFIILLGALLVFLVGESLNKSHMEKNRKTFLFKIKPIIGSNIKLAESNIHIIKDKPAGCELSMLKNIWGPEDPDPAKIGLKEEMMMDLLVLKESVTKINENISDINALKVKFNTLKDSTKFTDIIGRIVSFENDLEGKLSEFIRNSEKMSIIVEDLISD